MSRINRWMATALVALLLCVPGICRGRAEVLALPEQLLQIGEEAFAGNAAIVEAVIPDAVRAIGDRAFFGCANLERITVPGSVVSFGEQALARCAKDLLVRTAPDSAACAYARANSIDYQADTTYRAVLVGQTYASNRRLRLDGPANDVAGMRDCLEAFGNTPYQVDVRLDLEADEILSAIGDAFGRASAADVSLF